MQRKLTVKVASKQRAADGIVALELVSPQGDALPQFHAGAHIDVHIDGLTPRQYSLCGDPEDRRMYRIGVLRDEGSRGTSVHLNDTVQVGDELQISEPKNHFPLMPAEHYVLLAGGIGITPLMCMAMTLHKRHASFELHYACRSESRAAFLSELKAAPYASQVHTWWDDVPGQSLNLDHVVAKRSGLSKLYVCGPTGLLDSAQNKASQFGWEKDNVHVEYFSGGNTASDSDTDFELEIASTGEVIVVKKSESALNAMLACGIDIPCSCEEGVCGMCITQVVSGTPDHRDRYLTDAEKAKNDVFAPCCSRSKSGRLVIAV